MRGSELARELGVTFKDIKDAAARHGVTLKSHSNTVPDDLEDILRRELPAPAPSSVERSPAADAATAGMPAPAAEASAKAAAPVVAKHVSPPPAQAAPAPAVKTHTPPAAPVAQAPATAAKREKPSVPAVSTVEPPKSSVAVATRVERVLKLPAPLRVSELAKAMDVGVGVLVGKLINMGLMISGNSELDSDAAVLLASEYGFNLQLMEESDEEEVHQEPDNPASLKTRPPVVVVMGHVDHGKTSLLDALRKTDVAGQEHGGITQHIGVSTIRTAAGRKVTFLDTPGHEAFTAMRARGAHATDIAILVVAADDGVMPQTIEAISHAKAADVTIIVAINKIDKPEANAKRVLEQLSSHGLVSESWGGDTVVVEVSAKTKKGLDTLLEMIILQADLLDLKANPDRAAYGVVIESRMDRGRGPIATVLVQSGTLSIGDIFVSGSTWGRVKALFGADDTRRIKSVGPAEGCQVLGFSEPPMAGDQFVVTGDEKQARELAKTRAGRRRQIGQKESKAPITLDRLAEHMKDSGKKTVAFVVKADVQGSLEVIRDMIERFQNDEVELKLLHAALGGINENDIMLAASSHAVIIGFNVRPDDRANEALERESVDCRTYNIIYELQDDIKKAVLGQMSPRREETLVATLNVMQTFKHGRHGTIAGCMVKKGRVERKCRARVVRDGKVVYEGKVSGLKRFKDDARSVDEGMECGLTIENFNDVKVGDVLEAILVEELAPTL